MYQMYHSEVGMFYTYVLGLYDFYMHLTSKFSSF
jgi:hypothetical protein